LRTYRFRGTRSGYLQKVKNDSACGESLSKRLVITPV
jgi:hypothetical protein